MITEPNKRYDERSEREAIAPVFTTEHLDPKLTSRATVHSGTDLFMLDLFMVISLSSVSVEFQLNRPPTLLIKAWDLLFE
jgi:hypothetical protein